MARWIFHVLCVFVKLIVILAAETGSNEETIFTNSLETEVFIEPTVISNVLQLRFLGRNASEFLEVYQGRDIIHEKFLTRSVGDGDVTVSAEDAPQCLYQGRVQGLADSRVFLEGCRVYSGYIYHNNTYWNIATNENKTGVYTISRSLPEKNPSRSCHVEHFQNIPRADEDLRKRRIRRGVDMKLLELYVVFDHEMFLNFLKSDMQAAVKYATEMTGHLDTMYNLHSGARIRMALVGVEVWKMRNHISIVTDAREVLDNYIDYAQTSLTTFRYDLTALIADVNFDNNIAGMAHVDVMCSPLSAAVIKHFPGTVRPAFKSAVSLAHEIGHALGLLHDTNKCSCADSTGKCIMAADTSVDPRTFSDCSKQALEKVFREGGASCLYDAPPHVYGGPVCGNGIREQGEVCDCGTVIECLKDKCCKRGCQLRSGAQCSVGGCCKQCKIVSEGVICRPEQNECDLEEFCDGMKAECPANRHLPDMKTCSVGSGTGGYCYKGKCRNAHAQCQYLWGTGSTAADRRCYQSNTRGSATGNCGAVRQGSQVTYSQCSIQNIMCGMLQCVTNQKSPLVGVGRQIVNKTFGAFSCISVAIDLGGDVPDPGLVDSGSPCINVGVGGVLADGVCLFGECVVLTTLNKTTCPKDGAGQECSSHGTCTNDGTCFCDDGYTSSDCSVPGGVTRVRTTATTLISTSSRKSSPTTPSTTGTTILLTSTGQIPTSGTGMLTSTEPTSPSNNHILEIILGTLGGVCLILLLFLCTLWRRPRMLWRWLENTSNLCKKSPGGKTSLLTGQLEKGKQIAPISHLHQPHAHSHQGHQGKGQGHGHGNGHGVGNQTGQGHGVGHGTSQGHKNSHGVGIGTGYGHGNSHGVGNGKGQGHGVGNGEGHGPSNEKVHGNGQHASHSHGSINRGRYDGPRRQLTPVQIHAHGVVHVHVGTLDVKDGKSGSHHDPEKCPSDYGSQESIESIHLDDSTKKHVDIIMYPSGIHD